MRAAVGFVALLASVGVAAGATLDLPGDYGSPAGCIYLSDGTRWEEAVSVLTPSQYKNFVQICEYVQVLPASDGSRVVTMLCDNEGESQTIDVYRIAKAPEGDTMQMFLATGELVDTVYRCAPAGGRGG